MRRLSLVVLACAASLSSRAQTVLPTSVVPLDQFILSASRTPQDPRYTSSSVSLIPLADVATTQIDNLKDAIGQAPGVILYNTGAVGSQSTVLMRGSNAHQTLFVVDGVRMNDRSSTYQNFFGAADLGGIDRIEVLRGPQSTLYGSSAMGGVILVDTVRGTGPLSGTLSATAGSFDTYGSSLAVKGASGPLGYSASLGYYQTDNDRPKNDFDGWSYTARADYTVSPTVLIGATFRGQSSDYHEPGSRLFVSPGTVDFSNYLTTAYAQVKPAETLTSRLTLASHVRDYAFTSSSGVSPLHNNRQILDWQNTWDATPRTQIVAGANFEKSRYTVSGARTSDEVGAGYASATLRPTDALTLTGGLRYDDFKSVGSATTGRAGLAWIPVKGTKLRATYGTGFSAPGSDDRYGVPSFGQLANPAILPEKSRGWDVGVDQEFLNGAATVGLTYFKNKFRNLFEFQTVNFVTFEGMTVNRALATTEGAELAVAARPNPLVQTRASYTYLEARNDANGTRLTRRPRHTGDAEITVRATKAWIVGAGVHVVASRLNGATPMEDYTKARVFTSYAVRPDLLLKLRVENALDETYEEVFGYPALPRGIFGGVEWHF